MGSCRWLPGTQTKRERLLRRAFGHRNQSGKPDQHTPGLFIGQDTFQLTTFESNMTEITAKATTTRLSQRPPPIYPTRAATPRIPIVASGRVIRPIVISSAPAHRATSSPPLDLRRIKK